MRALAIQAIHDGKELLRLLKQCFTEAEPGTLAYKQARLLVNM